MAKLTSTRHGGQGKAPSHDRSIGQGSSNHEDNHGDGQVIVSGAGAQEEPVRESQSPSKRYFVAGKVFNSQQEAMRFLSLIK